MTRRTMVKRGLRKNEVLPPPGEARQCCQCRKEKTIHFFGPKTWNNTFTQRRCCECRAKNKPKNSRARFEQLLGRFDMTFPESARVHLGNNRR